MNDRPFVVIFLTDGQPTIGTTDEQQIVAHVKQAGAGHTRIFCFGIGTDVNTHLLDKIAEETHAFSQYVLPDEDLELKVSNFYAKIKEPVLANPRLRFTGDARPSKLYPSPLPDLFKGEQLVLVGRYAGSGAAAVLLEGSVNGTPKKHTYEVSFPAETSENEFIPRLWATRRVGYLLDEIRLHGENSELREETTELARKYGIVTPYTAYLILDDEAHRNVPMAMRSMQGLEKDQAARGQAEKTWNEFKVERAGESAIVTARAATTLKMADAPAQAAADNNLAFSRRYGLAPRLGGPAGTMNLPAQPSPADNQAKLAQYAQQNQFVAGKNFFQNDKQWIDGAVQQLSNTNRVRIQFNSTEYFDFARKNPRALPWLALGQNVQFALGNTVYEIYE
jgi:Ca-activated chloride channel family protein